jgi:hypothetical protein
LRTCTKIRKNILEIKQNTTPLISIKVNFSLEEQSLKQIRIKRPDDSEITYGIVDFNFDTLNFQITNVNDLSVLGEYKIIGYTIDTGDYITITETGIFRVVEKFHTSFCTKKHTLKETTGPTYAGEVDFDYTGWTVNGEILQPGDPVPLAVPGVFNNGQLIYSFEDDTVKLGDNLFVGVLTNGGLIHITETIIFHGDGMYA